MNWMGKSRPGATGTATAVSRPGAMAVATTTDQKARTSNGLKEFLWLLSDIPRARVLDLGPVWQATVNFFLEKGFRISTEDLLGTWKDFVSSEEERMRTAPLDAEGFVERVSAAALAQKFLETALQYPPESVHGVLAWDLLDYFNPAVSAQIMERLYTMLHPGGAVLALFHSRAPERYHRYRIADTQTIELVDASTLAVHARVFRNREILELFEKFRSSKTFVGRDQVREGLFLK
jgi:hypothetical protein